MRVHRIAAIGSSVVVIVSVLIGLYVSGAPSEQRLKRLDSQRISDLQEIVRAMGAYTWKTKTLPASLPDLVDGRRLSRLPSDPVTGIPYSYEVISASKYKLCARFDLPSEAYLTDDFWFHEQGQVCYAFEVERDD